LLELAIYVPRMFHVITYSISGGIYKAIWLMV